MTTLSNRAPRLSALVRCAAEFNRTGIKRGACGGAGPASASASALEGPAGARRANTAQFRRSASSGGAPLGTAPRGELKAMDEEQDKRPYGV